MTAEVLMERDVVTIHPGDSCRHAASQMAKGGFGSLPVVDHENKLLGIVSEFVLLELFKKDENLAEVPVLKAMTRKVQVVQADTSAREICERLQDKHLIRMPVMQDGKLVGIVARRDILLGYIKATAEYWP